MVMVRAKNEKLLSGDVDSKIVDKFLKQVDSRGFKKKRALAAAVQLWMELPEEVQAKQLNQSLESNTFVELVRQIADEQIKKAVKNTKK